MVTTQVGSRPPCMPNRSRCDNGSNWISGYQCYKFSMLGLSCAIICNSLNGETACFFAVSIIECMTAYASAPRNVRKSPATFNFVFAGLTARSLTVQIVFEQKEIIYLL